MYDYSVIILLYSLRISSVAVVSTHTTTQVENWPFYTTGLTATTSDRRLSTSLNMGFVKQKAWCAHNLK